MLLSLLDGSNYPAQFIQNSVLQVSLAFTCQESNKNYKMPKQSFWWSWSSTSDSDDTTHHVSTGKLSSHNQSGDPDKKHKSLR